MYQLIYLSSATEMFTKEKLLALLEQSRPNNARLGITGILLYSNGNFMQTLEGEEPIVNALFKRIARDPRHQGLLDLIHEEVPQRDFPDWTMGFRDLSLDTTVPFPGFTPFLNRPLTPGEFADVSAKTRTLLHVFKKTCSSLRRA